MGKIIDRTGQIFNNLQITHELGSKRVLAKCLLCNSVKEYGKSDIVGGRSKSCGCAQHTRLKDRTGEVFGNLEIIKELGGHKVIARCLLCKSEKPYIKDSLIKGSTKTCGCAFNPNFIDRTGQTFNNLQIIKELGNKKVIAKCLICLTEKELLKNSIVTGHTKSCGCVMGGLIDKTGQIYANLQIIKELGNGKVTAKCLLCESKKDYRKSQILSGNSKHCGCGRGLSRIKNIAGQIYNNIEIIEELRENKVKGKCLKCGHTDTYTKNRFKQEYVACKNCGLVHNYKDRIIGDIIILDFAYIGRDKNKYYSCKCIKCNEKLILTSEEIVKYTCDKR